MKKALILMILALFGSKAMNAQIQIQDEYANDLIIIGNVSIGGGANAFGAMSGDMTKVAEHKLYCRMFGDKTTYGILVDTGNRFDDDFEFALGTDIVKAIESVETLLEFMKTRPLGTSINVIDEDGRTIQINLEGRNTISLKVLDGSNRVIAEDVILLESNLKRAKKLLETQAEKKVMKAMKKNGMYVDTIELDESEMIYL